MGSRNRVKVSGVFLGTSGVWKFSLTEAVGSGPACWHNSTYLCFSSKEQADEMRKLLLSATLNCVAARGKDETL